LSAEQTADIPVVAAYEGQSMMYVGQRRHRAMLLKWSMFVALCAIIFTPKFDLLVVGLPFVSSVVASEAP
jgi:hypothetical protein